MAKFKPGEIVIYVGSPFNHEGTVFAAMPGQEVEFVSYESDSQFVGADGSPAVIIKVPSYSGEAWCAEGELRKRRPPEQPADDQIFTDWFNRVIKKEPVDLERITLSTSNPKAWEGWKIEVLGNGS